MGDQEASCRPKAFTRRYFDLTARFFLPMLTNHVASRDL
jgi:hypothetical protein